MFLKFQIITKLIKSNSGVITKRPTKSPPQACKTQKIRISFAMHCFINLNDVEKYSIHSADPDVLVDWNAIQLVVSSVFQISHVLFSYTMPWISTCVIQF